VPARRIDHFYFQCQEIELGSYQQQCPTYMNIDETCMCAGDLDQLNEKNTPRGGHYIAMTAPQPGWIEDINSNGNTWMFAYDKLDRNLPSSPISLASAQAFGSNIVQLASGISASGNVPNQQLPRFFLLNEISRARWGKDSSYRQFVVNVAAFVAQQSTGAYRLVPIVFSPFLYPNPAYAKDWAALSRYAIVAAEAYIDSKTLIKTPAGSKRLKVMQAFYNKVVKAYGAAGIRASRLAVFEHYGSTAKKFGYGRSGVKASDWVDIIHNRNVVFKGLKTWAVGTYGWFSNSMKLSAAVRSQFYAAYNKDW